MGGSVKTALRITTLLAASCAAGASFGRADDVALVHARALLHRTILVDGHNDLPWEIHESPSPMDLDHHDLSHGSPGGTDLPRLRSGEIGAQVWSVYIPGDQKDGHFARTQLEQIDLARRMIEKHPAELVLAVTAADVKAAHARGKIASLLGMEGGHAIEDSLGVLRAYYDLGVRSMTLTHNATTAWADAASDRPRHGGLTPFGKAVVAEMNRLGMIVDLSHVSPDVMRDALDASDAPVIFSHSCAKSLADHVRNVPDEILRRMPANGGVVMVTFVPIFASGKVASWWAPVWDQVLADPKASPLRRVREAREKEVGPEPKATVSDVADQIEYVRKLAGIDHVGLGGDYPATAGAPVGLEDVSKYPALFAELIRRGWSDDDLIKLAGGNFLRALAQVEYVSAHLRASRPASLATIEAVDRVDPGATAVLALEDAWTKALVAGDRKAFEEMLDDALVYTEGTATRDRATVLAGLTSGAETIEAARNEGMVLHDLGTTAIVTGWLLAKGRGPDGAFDRRYRYTDTWVYRWGRWRIVAAHDVLAPASDSGEPPPARSNGRSTP